MALPDSTSLKAGTSRTSGIAAASVATTANYIGSEINNATNLDELADIELTYAYGTNPTAAKTLSLHILYAFDGTNYEEGAGDGSGTGDVDPMAHTQIGAVSPAADTSTHRKLFGGVPLLPYKFKLLVRNVDTGQTATVTVTITTRKAVAIID